MNNEFIPIFIDSYIPARRVLEAHRWIYQQEKLCIRKEIDFINTFAFICNTSWLVDCMLYGE